MEITKEEYLKLADAAQKLFNIIEENNVITLRLYHQAMDIFNAAEIRTFRELSSSPTQASEKEGADE